MLSLKNTEKLFLTFFILSFVSVVLRNAWISDDAYITFRTVDNFVNGYGITWNIGERVQAYTHPLWMFSMASLNLFTREVYYTSIFFSVLISLATLLLFVFWLAKTPFQAFLGLIVLILSKAYVDYSTSGLENPLSHLLLVLFFLIGLSSPAKPKNLFWVTLTASFGMINRLDLFLIFLPSLIHFFLKVKKSLAWPMILLGLLPFFFWEVFSLFYYGFPFPNTAYAKLNTGLPQYELARQGLYYLLNSFSLDPLTLITIFGAMVIYIFTDDRSHLPLVIGIALYLAYLVSIGGDFMSGRFLTAPLLSAVILLGRFSFRSFSWKEASMVILVVLIGLSSPYSPVYSGTHYGMKRVGLIDERGIADERAFYFPHTGLFNEKRFKDKPHHFIADKGKEIRGKGHSVILWGTMGGGYAGLLGFYAGPGVHIIDAMALSDPLLAHLPPIDNPFWRIGHFERMIPDGYLETVKTGKNQIKDRNLADFYVKLYWLTRGDLFNWRRLKEIWMFNTGQYNHLVDLNYYRFPFRLQVPLSEIQLPKRAGTPWNQAGNIMISHRGLLVDLERPYEAEGLEISLDNNDDYLLIFFQEGKELARQMVPAPPVRKGGLAIHRISVPPEAFISGGVDRIKIVPLKGDGKFSIGHLRFLEPG
ncbi:MAG: hypothetical protein HY879_12985 [Deltaproteobacteria bacterium]|nr:hypothetical protein [Deltaproteobacteria bacterium]